jgi:hypothetical protein
VPLHGTSSADRKPLSEHCLYQAVAHFGEKCWLAFDHTTRQGLLKLEHGGGGDFGVLERQFLEPRQPVEMRQTGIGDFRVGEAQFAEVLQACEMREAGVGDLRVAEP